jgi:hypothetical protein
MGNSLKTVSRHRLSRREIEDAESAIWLFASMQISVLETQQHGSMNFAVLDQNILELDRKIGRYIYELTMKHLTPQSFYAVSLDLEKILKFGNMQKHSYRLMIDMIKETIVYLDGIVTSIDGVMLEDISSEHDLRSTCHEFSEKILSKYQTELSRSGYPLSQANIRMYNLHRIISDQISHCVDSYTCGIIEQVKGTVLIEVDQLLCTAIASEIFNISANPPKSVKKALTVIDSMMCLFDDAKDKFMALPFTSQRRFIDSAIEEISYKIDTIIRQIQIAYSSDKVLLQQLTFGIDHYYEAIDEDNKPEDSENIPAQDNVHEDLAMPIPHTVFPGTAKKSRKRDNAASSADSDNGHGVESSAKKSSRKKVMVDVTLETTTPRRRRLKTDQ